MQLLIILHLRNINKDVLRKLMKDQMKVVNKHSAFT